MRVGVVIPAAGLGKRMGSDVNKQYLLLLDRPVLAHTIQLFYQYPSITQIIVVVRENELSFCRTELINKYFNCSIQLIAGGKTRRESVYAGLKAFSAAIDYVIIHDGARPLLTKQVLNQVIESLPDYRALTVGVELKDTIKRIDQGTLVVETPNRSEFVSIQTPQAFAYDLLMRAHQEAPAQIPVTDDASLVERLGYPVKVVKGSDENIKITTRFDLQVAEMILMNR